ncbi:hypothetical protein F4820DRAFT_445390 [Hypoxylon rubiginosum]|uniref:Uncharacterized protein n=1 Tax=Hypoxylon rubiginosum TaxID=110542 RepID=A0ACB9Z8V2_9PEZI|nr:hypothetical protein F4820DRAFT_445390 [Hypoxylon rubiginosum]
MADSTPNTSLGGGSGSKSPSNKSLGSEQPSSEPLETSSVLESALEEIANEHNPSRTSGPVVSKQPAQLVRNKRSHDEAIGSTFTDLTPGSLSGRVVMATESDAHRTFKRGKLVDIEDVSRNPAPNFVIPSHNRINGVMQEGDVLESQLIPIWKQQNNGVIPPTLFSFTSLRTRFNRAARLRPADATYRKTGDLEVAELSDDEGTSAAPITDLSTVPAPAPTRNPTLTTAPANAPVQLEQQLEQENKRRRRRNRRKGGNEGQEGEQSRVNQASGSITTLPPPPTCANCHKANHLLGSCPGPVDQDGFLPGCVLHNTMKHSYDECRLLALSPTQQHVSHTIIARAGLPPVRTLRSWPEMALLQSTGPLLAAAAAFPLTRRTSLAVSREAIETYDFGNPSPFQLATDPQTHNLAGVFDNMGSLRTSERVPVMEPEDNQVMGDQPLDVQASKPREPLFEPMLEDEVDYEDSDGYLEN